MPSLGLRLDARALRSQVARRIFAVFVACALLPMGTFAGFAFWQVRTQLEIDARDALRSASKSAGMSVLERLLIAEQELRVLGAQESGQEPASLGGRRIVQVERWSSARAAELLNDAQQIALEEGRTVLAATIGDAPPAQVRLLRIDRSAGAVLVATLSPDFVFAPLRRVSGDSYWVADESGHILFESPPGAARAAAQSPGPGGGDDAQTARLERDFTRSGSDGVDLGASWPLFLRTRFHADSWQVAFARPLAEVQRPLHDFELTFPLIAVAALGSVLLLSLVQIRRSFVPIDELAAATRRLSAGDLDARVRIDTGDEFEDLGRTFNEMTEEIGRQIRVLRAVNGVGRALSAELDSASLVELILGESVRATESAGAALFLGLDGAPLRLAGVCTRGRDGAEVDGALPLDPVVARRCLDRGATLSHGGTSELTSEEREAWQAVEPELGFQIGPLVAVPMRARGDAIGVLILLRGLEGAGFGAESCELAESLASQAATAISKNHMVDSFRALFEGVIQLTVRAIDEKSSYTGDHCRKVPILTEMIADAACTASRGPLKDFDLSPEERYELRIAALLHDCGKVATPVHVMDKATKLETIYDRIDLVDHRFEILRRDIAADPELASEDRERRLDALEEDRLFLHRCNRGAERMSEADAERLNDIAERHTYVDRTGAVRSVLTADELLNLGIRKGTLNRAERQMIEQHVVTTIELLSELPFPSTLAGVPEIAGSHHERVDGSGYPNRLTRDQITLQGRILGLADVFEALTAKDRPYKEGRTLTETFQILDAMRDEGAIDPDLYDLFVRDKVYLPYVADNVAREQVDGQYWEELELYTSGT